MNAEIRCRRGHGRAISCPMLLAAAIALVANPAAAQQPQQRLTAKVLLADAVSEIGAKHTQVDDAITKFFNGDQTGAYTHLKNAKALAKEIPPPEVLMAKLWMIGSNEQAARAWLEKAVTTDPLDPEPYSILGEAALAGGRVTDAETLFAKSLELAAKFTANDKRKLNFQRRGLQGLAVVAQKRLHWNDAKGYLDRWMKIDVESPSAHAGMGLVLFYLDKPADAYKEFQEADRLAALAADSKDKAPSPMAEINMAQLYQRRDNDDKRTSDLIALAVKNHPKDFGVRLQATIVAVRSNLMDVALTQSEAAIKMDENNLSAKLWRGMVARLRGDFKTAEHYFELAHLQSPGNFDAANNLALLLSEQKDDAKKARAFEFALMNIQRFPANGQSQQRYDALATYGWVQYQLKNQKEAEQALQAVVNANVLTPDSKYYVARLLSDRDKKRNDDAIKFLTEATESDAAFANRKAAEDLLASLKKKSGGAGSTGTSNPAKSPAKAGAGK
jgi:Tfp pilus assembly protein PilF